VAVLKHIVTNQVQLVGSEDIDDETALAISEISQNATGGLKIKLYDKRAALVDIGKHLGMFTDKVQLSGDPDSPLQTVTRIELVAPKRDDGQG
jgi:phage terminase small subunit